MYQETEQNHPFDNEFDLPLDLYEDEFDRPDLADEQAKYQADPAWDRWLRDLGNYNDDALAAVADVAVLGID